MGHEHAESRRPGTQRRLALVCAFTAVYLVVEVIAGFLTHSLALLADAGHMLTDVAALALALFAMRMAERKPTPGHTYGFYRAEILAATVNAVALLGVSAYVLYEAYGRLRSPPAVASGPMLIVAAVGLVVNGAGVLVLRERSGRSLNMQGAYFEVLSDLVTSLAVIVAALVIWATGWYSVDPLLSAGIGLFIVPRTWKLLREAIGVLLEGTPADVDLDALREVIRTTDGVAAAHDLHVWSLTTGVNAMSVHVVLAEGRSHDEVRRRVHERVRGSFTIAHQTVQVESQGCAAEEVHL